MKTKRSQPKPPPHLLDRVQIRLDDYRTDKQAGQRLAKDFSQQCAAACTHLIRLGYESEVKRFHDAVERAEVHSADGKAVVLIGHSIRALCRYQLEGEATLFETLPVLFTLDAKFFLAETWVQKVVAEWLEQGEVEKLAGVFSGLRKGKRGARSYKLVRENLRRDQRIVDAVAQKRRDGCGYNEAMRQVAQNLDTLRVTDRLSPMRVRKIFEEWQRGIPSFVRFYASL